MEHIRNISQSQILGTLSSPITITNYNGEEVIIDGINNTLPPKNSGTPLIGVYGDWVTIKNMTIRYAGTFAVYTIGSNVTLENLYVHHNWGGGIILSGNHDVLQNSRIWYNSTMNENGQSTSGWGTGASCARYPEYCTIRNNTVWQNWGEGVSTFKSMHTNIEGNISYDNHQNFYLSDTKYSTMQRNLSYCTTDNALNVKQTQCGILIGDEKGVPIPLEENGERHPSSDNTIINNLVIGCNHNLAVGTDAINNNLFSNNTLVNSRGSVPNPYNVLFYTGETKNARFENNIIIQDDYKLIGIFAGGEGINFSNNLWSHVPPKNLSGQGDIIADPLFAKYGYTYSPNRYILTKKSPAINNRIKKFPNK